MRNFFERSHRRAEFTKETARDIAKQEHERRSLGVKGELNANIFKTKI